MCGPPLDWNCSCADRVLGKGVGAGGGGGAGEGRERWGYLLCNHSSATDRVLTDFVSRLVAYWSAPYAQQFYMLYVDPLQLCSRCLGHRVTLSCDIAVLSKCHNLSSSSRDVNSSAEVVSHRFISYQLATDVCRYIDVSWAASLVS